MTQKVWRVNKTKIGSWEAGYCRISDFDDWLRIWIRREEKSYTGHLYADGTVSLTDRWPPQAVHTWLEALKLVNQFDPALNTPTPQEAE